MTPPDLNERFTAGDCHILAAAIHDLAGWPIATFVTAWEGTPVLHAFCVHPSGDAVDVEGRQPMAAFRESWTKRLLHKEWGSVEELREAGWFTSPRWADSPEIAREVAQRIVQEAD